MVGIPLAQQGKRVKPKLSSDSLVKEKYMDNLQSGIAAFKSGNREDAREYLIAAVKENPKDENAWGWLYQVANNNNERIDCLKKVTAINPKNEKAKQLLDKLLAPQLTPIPEITDPPQQKQVSPLSSSSRQVNPLSVAPQKNNRKKLIYSIVIIVSLCLVCLVVAIAINAATPSQLTTPIATQAEISTNTHQPTVTPQQIPDTYETLISEKVLAYIEAFRDVNEYVQQVSNDTSLLLDNDWKTKIGVALGLLNFRADEMAKLEPSPKYVPLMPIIIKLADETHLFTAALANFIDNLDNSLIEKANQHLNNITTLMQEVTTEMDNIKATP